MGTLVGIDGFCIALRYMRLLYLDRTERAQCMHAVLCNYSRVHRIVGRVLLHINVLGWKAYIENQRVRGNGIEVNRSFVLCLGALVKYAFAG